MEKSFIFRWIYLNYILLIIIIITINFSMFFNCISANQGFARSITLELMGNTLEL